LTKAHHKGAGPWDKEAQLDVSVVIISYNVRDFLEQCLHSIQRACEGLQAEVLVVDNASRDSSAQMVENKFPWVQLMANRVNRGFSGANNQAIKAARGRYVLLINPDTLAREDTVESMIKFMDNHPRVGAAGCKILNSDGTLQLSCRRSFPTPWVALSKLLGLGRIFPRSRIFGRYNLTYLDPQQMAPVDALSGSFMFLRRETLQEVGLLDEEYFMYGEDLDLCYRIKQAGWDIFYVPDTQIIHFKGKSTEASASTVLDFYRAMHIFVRKHLRRRYLFFLHWFLVMGIAVRAAISFMGRVLQHSFPVLLDLLAVNLALIAAILLRFSTFIPLPPFENLFSYLLILGVCSLIWLLSFWALGLYDRRRYSPVQAFWAVTLGFLLISTLTYFKKEYAFSRIVILTSYLLNLLMVCGWRLLFRLLAKTAVGRSLAFRRAVIVGADEAGKAIVTRLRGRLDLGSRVVGFVTGSQGEEPNEFAGLPVLGVVGDLPQILNDEGIEQVIVATASHSYASILEMVVNCAPLRISFKLVPSPYEVMIGGTRIDRIDDLPMVEIRYRPLLGWNRVVKRSLDVNVSAILLLITCPISLIWSSLRIIGPQRYRTCGRTVSGKGKTSITLFSREIESETMGRDQLRRIHYRWGLDKLPFLTAVLRGDLSLVGPEIVETDPGKTLVLRPGLTGFVQIHLREGLTLEERVEYEIYYLRHQSLMLDLQIILRALWEGIRNADRPVSPARRAHRKPREQIHLLSDADKERIENERVRSRF